MQQTEFRTGVIRPMECFREAWDAIKPNYWLVFVVTMVGALIGGLSAYVLFGAMACGIYSCYLSAIDGEPVEIEHLFRGFRYFWTSIPVTILIVGPIVILMALIYLPLIYATYMGQVFTQEELLTMLTSTLLVEFVFVIIMVCLHTLILFSYPLIVDRGLSGWMSVTVSARAVWKNLRGVTGIWALSFVATLAGYLVFCVCLYFVIPLVLAANVAAYRKVFPKLEQTDKGPPSPDHYDAVRA
jgi:uncharacterized membrane protein